MKAKEETILEETENPPKIPKKKCALISIVFSLFSTKC
jgi:hypothetical protein